MMNSSRKIILEHDDGEFSSSNTSSSTLLDPEEFRRQGHMMVDFLADYFHNIQNYPVRSQVEPGYLKKILPDSAPYQPESIEEILEDVKRNIFPGLTHWQSPNFFAYFPCISSSAGILGEMLSVGLNVVGFSWITSPAATELENIVMDWLGKLINLPNTYLFSGGGGGVIQGTICEAMLCTIVAARDQMLEKIGRDNIGKLVVYSSDQTHSCFQKSIKISGIRLENFRAIPTTKATEFALCPKSLREAIQKDIKVGLVPLFLCATIGTTSTTTVDPLHPLCQIAKEYGIWVHVDAAYAGSACICPEFQHFLNGVENADSFSLNAHKWLFCTLDCCCLWVKDPNSLTKALSTTPEYLRNKASESQQVVDYKNWQITLSRRFRALKLWFVLRCHGVVNIKKFIRSHIKMAKNFEGLISMDERFEIVVPTNFSMVCFRVSPSALQKKFEFVDEVRVNEFNEKLLESINSSGVIHMTHTIVGGIYMIRFAIGAPLTHYSHITNAWDVIQNHANVML
ncbi:tyrosine decarboxylase 1-like [Solanum pennellii]|uniref:Tyrosine decarboxylase 1-like n=1 Tax=Solanum pennellii TaxID=28526 RepID=A0ABM1GAU7_SOLPN|nr:tyrosine decarboxylase 1-like [Solanum pennellii]